MPANVPAPQGEPGAIRGGKKEFQEMKLSTGYEDANDT